MNSTQDLNQKTHETFWTCILNCISNCFYTTIIKLINEGIPLRSSEVCLLSKKVPLSITPMTDGIFVKHSDLTQIFLKFVTQMYKTNAISGIFKQTNTDLWCKTNMRGSMCVFASLICSSINRWRERVAHCPECC